MLADLGAEVVKLEPLGRGDDLRTIGRYRDREEHQDYFNANNHSKKSIALDLKDPAQRTIGQELAAQADVVVENFAPGTAERLGMGWEELEPLNPRLVYCSVSGFGQTGPFRSRLGMDPIIQASSGVMSVTGFPYHGPVMVGAPLADVIAGMYAAYTVIGALYAVARDGQGRRIDISMQAAMVAALGPRMGEPLQANTVPDRIGNQNAMRAPSDVYETRDGVQLFVMVLSDRVWAPFCRAMDCPNWLSDRRFATAAARVDHRDILNAMVKDRFVEWTASYLEQRLEAERVPFSRVNNYAEALVDPQIVHRGIVHSVDHPTAGRIRVVGPPWTMTGLQATVEPPPLLDQHGGEVLADWLGWDAAEIERFVAARSAGPETTS